jgi:peptide/nickel transport system substrate-binding protein
MTVQNETPPVGVGPYKFGKVTPNQSYELDKVASFGDLKIDSVPAGHVDKVAVSVQSNNTTQAQQVLSNQVDIFDWADTLPAGLLQQVKSQAADRFKEVSNAYTYYFFLDTTQAPFNNPVARQAVNMALDRTALAKLAAGAITPACYFLPPSIVGHPSGYDACPGGDPSKSPSADTVAKAKKMISDAGLAGSPVTVWSQTKSPRQEYDAYFTDLLNQLGFKATLNTVQDSVYFQTIGNANTHAQAGFADWSQDFPHPADFYLLLSKAGIQPVNNENFGNVDDPQIESQLAKLLPTPAGKLKSDAAGWQSLEKYVAKNAYIGEFGYGTSPMFTSNRVNFGSAAFNPVYGWMFNTVTLK